MNVTRVWLFVLLFLSLLSAQSDLVAQVLLRLPELRSAPGGRISIPVTLSDIGTEKVSAFEFVVSCDTSVLQLEGVEQQGTLSDKLLMLSNNRVAPYNKGRMKVACASAYPISHDGVLVKILARLTAKRGTSVVELSNVVLNAGKPASKLISGLVSTRSGPKKAAGGSRDSARFH
jgi:hypothetical protein